MSINTQYKVLGLGNPFCDRSAYVEDKFLEPHKLVKGSTTVTDKRSEVETSWSATQKIANDYQWTLGGSCTNVIKTLAHFGQKCAVYGKIGADCYGEKVKARLNQIGVTSLLTKGKNDTGTVNCFVTPDAQRTMHTYLGASQEFSECDILEDRFRNIEHVHLEGYSVAFGKVLETSISYAQKNHTRISLDLASRNRVEQFKSKFEKCIYQVDFLFGNAEEMQALTGFDVIKEAAEIFDSHQTIVVTNGSEGCWVKWKGDPDAVCYKALEVPIVKDTTGAGDFFDGGFLNGVLKDKDVSSCVKMGNLAASFVIQYEGAELSDDKWHELSNLISKI